MNFTAELGTDLSMPGNIALGSEPESAVAPIPVIPKYAVAVVTVPERPMATITKE